MKKDKLEQFVGKNREAFDDLRPDPTIWNGIQKDIRSPRQLQWKTIMWRAAAVIMIFTASYFFHDMVNSGQDQPEIAQEQISDQESFEEARTFIEAEAYYTSRIGNMKKEVYRMTGKNSRISRDMDLEFKELDRVLKDLKQDLGDNAANTEVLEAMIQNYRMKLMILEEMLEQLKASRYPIEERKNDEHEI